MPSTSQETAIVAAKDAVIDEIMAVIIQNMEKFAEPIRVEEVVELSLIPLHPILRSFDLIRAMNNSILFLL